MPRIYYLSRCRNREARHVCNCITKIKTCTCVKRHQRSKSAPHVVRRWKRVKRHLRPGLTLLTTVVRFRWRVAVIEEGGLDAHGCPSSAAAVVTGRGRPLRLSPHLLMAGSSWDDALEDNEGGRVRLCRRGRELRRQRCTTEAEGRPRMRDEARLQLTWPSSSDITAATWHALKAMTKVSSAWQLKGSGIRGLLMSH
jgi:hypothetical protein